MGRKKATRGLDDISGKQIVLDTSIIILLADKEYRSQIIAALENLENRDNEFFVSELTVYELNKTSVVNADVAKKAKLLKRFSPLPVDQGIFVNAGILFAIMKNCQGDFKNKENDIGCDMIIGGTVLENAEALLMTTNINDFRVPCWEIVAEGRVVKKNQNSGWHLDNWYLLKFNYAKMRPEFLSDELRARYHGGQERLLLP